MKEVNKDVLKDASLRLMFTMEEEEYDLLLEEFHIIQTQLGLMSKIEGVKWIRILYMYLFETTDELIEEIAKNNKVCKYFDIPIQHLNNKMLKDMNRHDTKEIIYDRIKRIRELVPNAVLRTTCIVGFPGETEEQFEELIDGIKELKFDRYENSFLFKFSWYFVFNFIKPPNSLNIS